MKIRIPFFVAIAVLIGLACHPVPVLAQSADSKPKAANPTEPSPAEPEEESGPGRPGMMYTGIGLASTGAALGIVGGILFGVVAPNKGGEWGGMGEGIAGFGMMITGGTMVCVGVPLWIIGALPKEPENQTSAIPQLTIGPTSVQARWVF